MSRRPCIRKVARVFVGFVSLLSAVLSLMSCQPEGQVARAGREGCMLVGNGAEPKSLDPHIVTGVVEGNIIRALFEGLCADHPSEDSTCLPGAAEKWAHSKDYKKWMFHLRPQGLWSDGVPLTAQDFVFSYQRILHPDMGAPYSSMLYFIKGAEAFNKGELEDFSEVGVKALGDFKLFIELREPVPYLPTLTRHYTWFPVPRHVVEKYSAGHFTDDKNPWSKEGKIVSNGPFKLTSWRLGQHILVEKNDHYWDMGNVRLNAIKFLPIENSFTETRAFLANQLHTTYKLPADLVGKTRFRYPEYLREEPYIGTVFYRLNTTRKPLDDVRVRQALSLSINREPLCQYVFRGYLPATGFTPGMQGYPALKDVSFSPKRAQELLADAGYPGGKDFPVFSILISKPEAKPGAEAVQAMWLQNLGIRVEIRQLDWSSYISAQHSLEYDIAAAGWIGDYLDPSTFLNLWQTGDGNNNTGWGNKEYDQMLRTAAAGTSAHKRYEGYRKAEEMFLNELPVLPLAWYSRVYLHRPEVKGWYPLLLDNHPWKAVWLDYPEAQ